MWGRGPLSPRCAGAGRNDILSLQFVNLASEIGFRHAINGHPSTLCDSSVIHQVAMPRVQPGMTVAVKIDPANPMNVALDV
jgi:hypothetical protein